MDEFNQGYNQFEEQETEEVRPEEVQLKRKKRTWLTVTAIALGALLVGCAVGAGFTGFLTYSRLQKEDTPQYQMESVPLPEKLQTVEGDKSLTPADVYAANVGAVVGISTESTPMTNIFGQVSATTSAGSGFVLTEDGYIVTNYHVVENANTIKVTLYSGESYAAQYIGGYADNDVALLKIEAEGLQYVTVGKSEDLVVGEQIVAIGNPLGELTYTMTVGYVSAMDREINASGKPINMLQTDVAINSGNSGGPVFDMNGNVIAIASAKYSGQTSSGTYIEGLSFAIPIDDVLDILYDLGTYGYVTGRPYLGITLQDLDSATAKTYGLPVGPIINSVESGSCAEKAGLRQGDIILALNGEETESYEELVSELRDYRAGDTVTITVFRGGQRQDFQVTLDEKNTQPTSAVQPQQAAPEQDTPAFSYDDDVFPFSFGFPFDFFFD